MKQEKLQELYDNTKGSSLLIASKTQPIESIEPFLTFGHRLFGENRVQEAKEKWLPLKEEYQNIDLHLIGPLQTNKVKEAVKVFDVIETLDREKLAIALQKAKTDIECYIQVNTGEEPQKSGVIPQEFNEFLQFCRNDCNLNINGLMCIPPINEPASPHFALLADIAKNYNISNLSMGMSSDYQTAIKFGATHIRIGTAIFGNR